MATQVGLINRALARIGEARIVQINEDSDRAQTIRDIWDDVRQAAIRSHPWNFAVRRAILAPVDGAPVYGFSYRFRRPQADNDHQGWQRTLGVFDDADERVRATYRSEGPYLLADVTTLYMRFIADITNVNNWDSLFREAMMLKLAAELAIQLANSNSLRDSLQKEASAAFARARSVDGIDEPPDDIPMGTWEIARFGDVV